MEKKAEIINILAAIVGIVGLYPLLLLLNRTYFHLALPGAEWDWILFKILATPVLLLLSALLLVVRGPALARAVGVAFLAVDVWWIWVLFHAEY